MKCTASYLLLPMLFCVYMATNMGFGVHTCNKDGTSIAMMLTTKLPCSCHDYSNKESAPSCCCCSEAKAETESAVESEEDGCCSTSIYVMDKAQNSTEQLSVALPAYICNFATLFISVDLFAPNPIPLPNIFTACIVQGPDGGLGSVTPLRL